MMPDVLTQQLLDIIKDLREENAALTKLLLEKTGVIEKEETVIVPESQQVAGREPWYLKKARLEKVHADKKHQTIRPDAGSGARVNNGVGDSAGSSEGIRGQNSVEETESLRKEFDEEEESQDGVILGQ